uniref:Uncharacterized protein n=1 Tax=Anguilla anguilla TaxID=7936 RepID=A0A0E9R853_ANGAN
MILKPLPYMLMTQFTLQYKTCLHSLSHHFNPSIQLTESFCTMFKDFLLISKTFDVITDILQLMSFV